MGSQRSRTYIPAFAGLAALAALLLPHNLWAQDHEKPSTAASESPRLGGVAYQEALVDATLSQQGWKREPQPQGKIIERVVVVPYDILIEQDPWPLWLNSLHSTTDADIVQRELLFGEGDAWDSERIEETARNLRTYLFVAVARIIPVRASQPDKVIALVVTKDLWSLRASSTYSFVGSKLELLEVEFAEHNLLGRMKKAGVTLHTDLATNGITLEYDDPRVSGSRIASDQRLGLIWNKSTGEIEGGRAFVGVQKPFYSLDTEWAWAVNADYLRDTYRLFSNGQVAPVLVLSTGETLPYTYDRELLVLTAEMTRSFGRTRKQNVSLGWRGRLADFEPFSTLDQFQPQSINAFRSAILPYSERYGMLFASYRMFHADYVQFIDLDTFALTEDFRLGPDLIAELGWASPVFGFSSAFLRPVVNFSYRWALGEDLLTVGAAAGIRYHPGSPDPSPWVNRSLSLTVKNASPRFSLFRLHSELRYVRRSHDLNREVDKLGGEGPLRGYPSRYFVGAQSWGGNVELRSDPITLYTTHIGGAVFFDVGDAANDINQLGAHASVGLGLRILFPQFNRMVVRLDAGLPLEPLSGGATPSYFVSQFGQAF